MPDLTIKPPTSSSFWKTIALETRKLIRKRTESKKVDVQGRSFKGYSESYKDVRRKAGRSTTPNLSFSSKMLASMRDIGKKTKAIVRISGFEGFKVYVNELAGRVFFGITKGEADSINKKVADEVTRINKLKKR